MEKAICLHESSTLCLCYSNYDHSLLFVGFNADWFSNYKFVPGGFLGLVMNLPLSRVTHSIMRPAELTY